VTGDLIDNIKGKSDQTINRIIEYFLFVHEYKNIIKFRTLYIFITFTK
jgi:hypothetical protein